MTCVMRQTLAAFHSSSLVASFFAPAIAQRFQGHIQSHLVAEFEAVGHRLGGRRYCNKLWIGSFQAAATWGLIPSMN